MRGDAHAELFTPQRLAEELPTERAGAVAPDRLPELLEMAEYLTGLASLRLGRRAGGVDAPDLYRLPSGLDGLCRRVRQTCRGIAGQLDRHAAREADAAGALRHDQYRARPGGVSHAAAGRDAEMAAAELNLAADELAGVLDALARAHAHLSHLYHHQPTEGRELR